MRITWSTAACTAAVFVLLVSGDEFGDGGPSGPHLTDTAVTADLTTAMNSARLTPPSGFSSAVALTAVSENGRALSPSCLAAYDPNVTGTPANYSAALESLVHHGWLRYHGSTSDGYVNTHLSKGGWTLTASRPAEVRHPEVDTILLTAIDNSC